MDRNGKEHHGQANQRVTLCVEGNISAGKSTVLQALLKGSIGLQHGIEVLLLGDLLESTSITERWQSVSCSYRAIGPLFDQDARAGCAVLLDTCEQSFRHDYRLCLSQWISGSTYNQETAESHSIS